MIAAPKCAAKRRTAFQGSPCQAGRPGKASYKTLIGIQMLLTCKNADNTPRWKQGERLNHLFEQRCDQLPADHVAIITDDGAITFRDLDCRANQVARHLLDQGLKAGDSLQGKIRVEPGKYTLVSVEHR